MNGEILNTEPEKIEVKRHKLQLTCNHCNTVQIAWIADDDISETCNFTICSRCGKAIKFRVKNRPKVDQNAIFDEETMEKLRRIAEEKYKRGGGYEFYR